ncbi:hypothetical protein AWZ03_014942 [Drosophila navojoa]|uniref:RRM domain-containing protein n=2 Tax=Drosophila navojoa TaxID=7232 RepID=A0A484AQ55_DRONA|nr:hypothetical protein AWZ03_014942 [Drosophila navojoa]
MVGQSRGYAFITFKKNEGAKNALIKLDGSNIGSRSIAVRLAKNIKYDDLQRPKPRLEIPALGRGKREDKISKSDAIRAIETKLRTLERQTDDNLELNTTREENVPFIHRYQFNKSREDAPRTRPHGKYNKPNPPSSYLRQLPNRR